MNVKPGDIARIVADPAGIDVPMAARNKLVTVRESSMMPICCLPHAFMLLEARARYGQLWDCKALQPVDFSPLDTGMVEAGGLVVIPDVNLRPLPEAGDDKDDEVGKEKPKGNVEAERMEAAWQR